MFIKIMLVWVLIISIFSFFRMGWDKRKASKEENRVPEKTFFKLAAIGGSLGILIGMQVWRHKTQKWKFKLPIFIIVGIQIILIITLYYFFWMEARG